MRIRKGGTCSRLPWFSRRPGSETYFPRHGPELCLPRQGREGGRVTAGGGVGGGGQQWLLSYQEEECTL